VQTPPHGTDDEAEGGDEFDADIELGPVTLHSSPSKRSTRSSRSSRSSVSSLWSSPRRNLSSSSLGREARKLDRSPSGTLVGASASEPTSPTSLTEPWELARDGGEGRCASGFGRFRGPSRSPQPRRVSDVSPVVSHMAIKNNATRSRSQDYPSGDYFQRNLKLKVS
jgi:hypothetical protein